MAPAFKKLTAITGSVCVAQSEVYSTNSAIFSDGGSACLIDPALLPIEILAIHNFLDTQRLRVENILLTHHHWDHLFGPEYFPGVRIIAQHRFNDELNGDGSERTFDRVQEFEHEHQIRRTRSFRLPNPDITFEQTITVMVGGMALEMIHAPGHSSDQSVIYQAESAILWAADMLSDLEIPFIYHSLKAYQETLERLSCMNTLQLVPGHGQIAITKKEIEKRFAEDKAYLAELRGLVEDCLKAGKSLEQTMLECSKMRFKHPKENAGPHRINVEMVYNEFS